MSLRLRVDLLSLFFTAFSPPQQEAARSKQQAAGAQAW
jgi:hypothetical protein